MLLLLLGEKSMPRDEKEEKESPSSPRRRGLRGRNRHGRGLGLNDDLSQPFLPLGQDSFDEDEEKSPSSQNHGNFFGGVGAGNRPFVNYDDEDSSGLAEDKDDADLGLDHGHAQHSDPANSLGNILVTGLMNKDPAAFKSLCDMFRTIAPAKQVELLTQINKLYKSKWRPLVGSQQLAHLNEALEVFEAHNEEYETSKTPDNDKLKSDAKKILIATSLSFLEIIHTAPQRPNAPSWEEVIRVITQPTIVEETKNGKKVKTLVGNIFSTGVLKATSETPTTLEIRNMIEKAGYGIDQAMFVSPKGGGKNNPGPLGANYIFPVQTPSGKMLYPMVFFKQATDFEKKWNYREVKYDLVNPQQNYQENIAEIIGGRIMNDLVGELSAPTMGTFTPGAGGEPGQVYVGSVFHNQFSDFHSVVFEGEPEKLDRTASTYFGKAYEALLHIVSSLTTKKLKSYFFKDITKTDGSLDTPATHLRRTFGIASGASLLVGNYQIHTENLGKARTSDGLISAVSLDYGGAGRRLYQKTIAKFRRTKTEKHGRFEREVKPLDTDNKKYGLAYLGDYSKELLESPEFIDGIYDVVDKSRAQVIASVNSAVDYAINLYGKTIFHREYAQNLDTRVDKNGNRKAFRNEDDVADETKKFLIDTHLARQLSLKEFALEQQIRMKPKVAVAALFNSNPAYAVYNRLDEKYKTAPRDTLINPKLGAFSKLYLLSDINVLSLPEPEEAVSRMIDVMLARLDVAEKSLQIMCSTDSALQAQMVDEINELKIFKKYLADANHDYNHHSRRDVSVLIQAIDESAEQIKIILVKLSQVSPPSQIIFLKQQELMTPTILENHVTPLTDVMLKQYADEMVLNSRNFVFQPPPYNTKPSHHQGMFPPGPVVAPQPVITAILTDYAIKMSASAGIDATARQGLETLLSSHVGSALASNPDFATSRFTTMTLPPSVLRTAARPIFSSQPVAFGQLSASNNQVLDRNQSALNYLSLTSEPVTKENLASAAVYKEQRKQNGAYSIRAVHLSQILTRTHNINEALRANGHDDMTANAAFMREIVKAFKKIELSSPVDQNAAITAFNDILKNKIPGITDDVVNKIRDNTIENFQKNCRQVIGGKRIPSDAYLEYAAAQVKAFLSGAGSDKTIRIERSDDRVLAQAYYLICKANNLAVNDQSGLTNVAEMADIPEALAHVQAQAKFKIAVPPTKEATMDMITALLGKMPDDRTLYGSLEKYKSDIAANKPVDYDELYALVEKVNAKMVPPPPAPGPSAAARSA
jgi:hypothetical protein